MKISKLLSNMACRTINMFVVYYSKTCVKRPQKIDKTGIIMTNGRLMKVESIAEYLGAFCNSFDLHGAIIGLEK